MILYALALRGRGAVLLLAALGNLLYFKIEHGSYLNAGVREYWVLDPEEKKAQVHVLHEGRYLSSAYKKDAVVPVSVLPPFSLDLATLWET